MPTPSPRNSIRIARGNIADLQASVSDIGEGELCFAIDENRFYSKTSGALVPVGGGTELISIDQMGDVDVTTVAPVSGQTLSWDGANWVPGSPSGAPVESVNSQVGVVVLDADDISDTSTTNKYTTASDISKLAGIEEGATRDQTGAEIKVAYEAELNTNAFTDAEKIKLAGVSSGANVNVNADWIASSGDAEILNKPTLGTAAAADTTDFATAAQGTLADSATQPGDLATVATSGSYDDLSDKPAIPVVDPNTVVTDQVPTFTATVQTTERTITAGTFDLATGNHWTCAAITVPAPANAVAGTSGLIRITAGPVAWNAVFKFPGGSAPTIASFPAVIPFYIQDSSNVLMGNVAEGIS